MPGCGSCGNVERMPMGLDVRFQGNFPAIPAKAGIQLKDVAAQSPSFRYWTPASAGVEKRKKDRPVHLLRVNPVTSRRTAPPIAP